MSDTHGDRTAIIDDADRLREHYGSPSDLARCKTLTRLDHHCRALVAASPFLVLATSDRDGRLDASPRGDAPGFVAVLDDRTLLVPDRPGNRRVDSFSNVLANPRAGLLFMVPGMNETLRVNGRARVTTDPTLLAPLAVNGRAPVAGLIVEVEEAFLHCAKALVRSKLWDPRQHVDRKSFPPLGHMLAEQIGDLDPEQAERGVQESLRKRLY